MRTIIAGSRSITDKIVLVEAVMRCGWEITTVLCGGAQGVDKMGEEWALEHDIPIEYYLANWIRFGKRAGFIRNAQMANDAETLIAIWDGVSKGTANMIINARRQKLKYFILAV